MKVDKNKAIKFYKCKCNNCGKILIDIKKREDESLLGKGYTNTLP